MGDDLEYLPLVPNARLVLKEHAEVGKRRRYRATFDGVGSPGPSMATRVLLVNVIDVATGAVVADHLWMDPVFSDRVRVKKGDDPDRALSSGDEVEFNARAAPYVKGLRRMGTAAVDFKLVRPSHAYRVPKQDGGT